MTWRPRPGLRQLGHAMRFATHGEFETLITGAGVEFALLPGRPREALSGPRARRRRRPATRRDSHPPGGTHRSDLPNALGEADRCETAARRLGFDLITEDSVRTAVAVLEQLP